MNKFLFFLVFFILIPSLSYSMECGSQIETESYNNFVLVADRSGSMSGSAITNAMVGIDSFLKGVQSNDYVALLTFASDVTVDENFTQNVGTVFNKVKSISVGGGTRLYDALGKAIQMLSNREGRKVIVFLTDGQDGGSNFTVRDLKQMNIVEDVFLYGIGLGKVDEHVLRNITNISHGTFEVTQSAEDLAGIYTRVCNTHYTMVGELESFGRYSITSIPSGRSVQLDGRSIGITPVRVFDVEPGRHTVEVDFRRGVWDCTSVLKAGYTCFVSAKESDLPNDLILETAPTRSAVFIDDNYIGFSSMVPSSPGRVADQLRIKGLNPGLHKIRIVPAPDFEFMSSKSVEFEINMTREPLFIKVIVLQKKYYIMDPNTAQTLEMINISGPMDFRSLLDNSFGGFD